MAAPESWTAAPSLGVCALFVVAWASLEPGGPTAAAAAAADVCVSGVCATLLGLFAALERSRSLEHQLATARADNQRLHTLLAKQQPPPEPPTEQSVEAPCDDDTKSHAMAGNRALCSAVCARLHASLELLAECRSECAAAVDQLMQCSVSPRSSSMSPRSSSVSPRSKSTRPSGMAAAHTASLSSVSEATKRNEPTYRESQSLEGLEPASPRAEMLMPQLELNHRSVCEALFRSLQMLASSRQAHGQALNLLVGTTQALRP